MLYAIGAPSPWSLLLILVIVVVIFGTKRLRNAGGDLGGAVKNFKDSMKSGEDEVTAKKEALKDSADDVIESTAKVKDTTKKS